MRADFTHNESVVFHLEGEAEGKRDAAVPNISRIIHFFNIQGRVPGSRHKQLKLLINGILYVFGQLAIVADKSFSKENSHILAVFRALRPFLILSKGPSTSSLAMSLSALASSCCHSSL